MRLPVITDVLPPHRCPVWVAAALVAAATAGAQTAAAEEQFLFRPALVLSGGLDDNLLFDNSGGDRIGVGGLKLNLKTWDRLWSVSLDVGASVYAFQERQKIVPLGESTLNATVELDRTDVFRARARVRGSDDPLGLAQIGLLGASGTVLGYRSYAEFEHDYDARLSLTTRVNVDGIGYLDAPFQQDSGEAIGAGAQPRYRLTRDITLEGVLEERTFVSRGIAGAALDLLPGIHYRVARRFFLELDAGPTIFHDTTGFLPEPVVRANAEYHDRNLGVTVTASQDLQVPSGRAGVLMTDLIEAAADHGTLDWEFRVRAGYYQSLSSPRASDWVPGYGVQAAAYRRIAPFAWVGLSALRFERIGTTVAPELSRDAVYAGIQFTQGRP